MFAAASQQAHELIARSSRILAITHVAPDGDAIGSLMGMAQMLRQMGKAEVVLACDDAVPDKLTYLSGASDVVASTRGKFDLIIILDCSDERRGGEVYRAARNNGRASVINIDHHITNTFFGDVNIVLTDTAATTEALVRLLKAWNLELNQDLALCLLTGLVTDTLCFRTANVTAEVMQVAAELMAAGADLAYITSQTVNRKSFNAIRFWGMLLSTLRLDDRIVSVHASAAARRAADFSPVGDASIVSFLVTAWEADIAVSLVEGDDGRVEVSLRARPGFDVSGVALALGGGGHPSAAGCQIAGPLPQAMERVFPLLRQAHREQTTG